MGYIHLIRHGTTEGNKARIYYGRSDLPLAGEGIDLITDLAAAGIYPKADGASLFTSGLLRTEQTFFLIYGDRGHDRITELEEYHFGDFELKTHNQLKEDPLYQAWISDKEGLTQCPGGESASDFSKRIDLGFAKVLVEHRGKENRDRSSIVVCHGGVISIFMNRCFPNTEKNYYEWQPEPGRGYSIHMIDGEPVSYEYI